MPLRGQALPVETRLRDYEITGLIGEGGFGIVYLAWDHSLQRKVAVKEYMPASMASRVNGSSTIVVKSDRHLDTFKAGLKSFVNEARLLARFDHPSLVKVYRFWEENGTAYMVMPYYEGPTLKAALAELGHVPSESELRAWLKPVLNAIAVLHDGGCWHHNIGADSIALTAIGPVLLGFASAEQTIEALNHAPAVALKPGFAAIEQYGSAAETTRGPWTDLYALAAVIYTAITGSEPPPAADRLAEDRLRPLSLVAAGLYSSGFLAAVDAALAVQPERRPLDHVQFRALMGDIEAPEPVSLAPPRDLMHEPFLGGAPGGREITVPDRPLLASAASAAAARAAPAETKPKAVLKTAPAEGAPARGSDRAAPSWIRGSDGQGLFGKRAAFGFFAMTFALIGIAALALQFYGRQSNRPAIAAAPAASQATAAALAAPGAAPMAAPITAAATLLAPVSTPSSAPPPPTAALATRAPSPTRPAVPSASAPTLGSAAPPAALAAPTDDLAAPETDRKARCLEILQKASLERISAAETDFFKRECK